MIEQIKDPATKRAISRKILEALHDWFEVDERACGFKELEVIKEIWGEENPCQIYVQYLK